MGMPADLSAVFSVLEKTECSKVGEKQKDQSPTERLVLDDQFLYLHPISPDKR